RAAQSTAALDAGWRAVTAREPGWASVRLDVPRPGETTAELTVQHGGRGRPDLRRNARVGLADGAVVALTTFDDESRGRRIRSWLRWIHTGEAGGIAGQAVAALASAGALLLVWTGWALAWRRFVRSRRRSHAAPSVPVSHRPPRRPQTDTLEEMTP
ncbi:MAG TPA: PepSY domain-containing protein, partial [Thermoanaerobaculia bacterium]|nr:PepSY domain-containing protein [Thermoanaerobaculia bacterium]